MSGLISLQSLNLSGNSLIGTIPSDVCSKSLANNLYINGDAANCPNGVDTLLGVYLDGCYDNVLVDVDIYLNEFVAIVLGDVNGNCNDLNGKESEVCKYIKNQANHAIFNNGYPEDNSNLWDWLKERTILVRMYLNDGGDGWSTKTNWLGSGDHCTWQGVACSVDSIVTGPTLDNNQLTGPFPTDLTRLSDLQSLNLSANSKR